MLDRRAMLATAAGAVSALAVGWRATAEIAPAIEPRDDLGRLFGDHGTTGTMVVATADRVAVVDRSRAETGYLPASTFKIVSALIAVETGVAADADNPVFRWDGTRRSIPEWNRDHTLRSAFEVSSVPTFQAIVRRVGATEMRRHVDTLGYGNRDIGGAPLDRFWLSGNLRITAFEQIDLLRRLEADRLPVSKRAQAIVKDVMLAEEGDGYAIRAKSGWADAPKPGIGWWVGWVERGQGPAFFALNLDVSDRRHVAARIPVAKAMLAEIGILKSAT